MRSTNCWPPASWWRAPIVLCVSRNHRRSIQLSLVPRWAGWSPAPDLPATPSLIHWSLLSCLATLADGRAFLFRRAGEALETGFAGRLPEVAGRLATLYVEAGESERAATFADMAAERSLALAAPQEAVAFYRRAIALLPTPERQLGMARALSMAGESTAARELTEIALTGFVERGDRLGAARASLELAGTYLPAGRGDEVLHWAEMSLEYLDTHAHPEVDPVAHAQAHYLLGAGRLRSGRSLDEAQDQLREAARLAQEKGLPAIAARSTFELGNLYALRGNLKEAIAAQHASVLLSRAAGDRLLEILGLNNAAYHSVLAGDLDTARADITLALALDDEQALLPPLQYLYSTPRRTRACRRQLGRSRILVPTGAGRSRTPGQSRAGNRLSGKFGACRRRAGRSGRGPTEAGSSPP